MTAKQDPLSLDSAEFEEDIPIDDADPKLDVHPSDVAPAQQPRADAHQGDQQSPPLSLGQGDTPSYGDLVGPSHSHAKLTSNSDKSPQEAGLGGGSTTNQTRISITVTDPQKVEGSSLLGIGGGHVTYLVATTTTLPGFDKPHFSVRRRFSEFVALATLLKATHRGYFIPPRPDKNPVEGQRAATEFVEGRRQALQHYCDQLATHPLLSGSQELRTFLEVEGPLVGSYQWAQLQPLQGSLLEGVVKLPKQLLDSAIPNPTEAAQSSRHTGDLWRSIQEARQNYRNTYREVPELDEQEVALRNENLVLDQFQSGIMAASRKAEALVGALEDLGTSLGDLGLVLIKVAKYEDEEGALLGPITGLTPPAKAMAADCSRVGKASVRLSRLARQATGQSAGELAPLHDHLALTPAVGKALGEREEALLTLQALQSDLTRKRRALDRAGEEAKQSPGDAARAKKGAQLQGEAAALEAAASSAEAEYHRVRERNTQELERWKTTRYQDFAHMLRQFAGLHAAYEDRCAQVWQQVAQDLGQSPQAAPLSPPLSPI